MTLEKALEEWERGFDANLGLTGRPFKSPGYHTKVPDGAWVHPTLDNLKYAVALLESGTREHVDRACRIIDVVLGLQDVDPRRETYGIWPWLYEEPLDQMARPDWNWADFCGGELALALSQYSERLPPDPATRMRAALGHAARAIVKRNVGPGYTNIAVAGGAVTAAAGELLDDARFLDYGRRRLERFVEYTREQGGFNEYNSPTYGIVTLYWCEWIMHVVHDAAARRAGEDIRNLAWTAVSEHFHPGTNQWAGPHSRAYADRLAPYTAGFLSARIGMEIPVHPAMGGSNAPQYRVVPALPAPREAAARFRSLPEVPHLVRRRFIRRFPQDRSTWGTTWFTEDACLGSVNHDTFWVQRRPIIGYWRTPSDPAVVFRVRLLHDGRDFASGLVFSRQEGPRILLMAGLATNYGDWHPGLDRPADATFAARELRLRFQLDGRETHVSRVREGVFDLAAGERRVRVLSGPGCFDDNPVHWETGRCDDVVFVDAVLYDGPRRKLALRSLGATWVAAGVECLGRGEAGTTAAPQAREVEEGMIEAEWSALPGLRVRAPAHPAPW